jgi:hypothetical protein
VIRLATTRYAQGSNPAFPSISRATAPRSPMQKILFPIILMLFSALAMAQDGANIPPSPTVDIIYVVIFCVLFVGSIVGFGIYIWLNDRKKRQQEGQ